MRKYLLLLAVSTILFLAVGCSSGTQSTSTTPPTTTPPTTTPPASSQITISPSSVTFTSNVPQYVTVSGGVSSFAKSTTTCTNQINLDPPTGQSVSQTTPIDGNWIVTPENNGTCTYTFSDGTTSATLTINVNFTTTESMTWTETNSCKYIVYLKFFDKSSSNGLQWPGPGSVITLNTPNPNSNTISCTTGHEICYGGSTQSTTDQNYWGVGITGNESCPNCCYKCATETVPLGNLTCANAQAVTGETKPQSTSLGTLSSGSPSPQ